MKIEISLNVAVVCAKPYAVELKDGMHAVCIPCMNPKTHEYYPVYMYFDYDYNDDSPSVGSFIAYEWDNYGRRDYLCSRDLSSSEKAVLRHVKILWMPYISALLKDGSRYE